ncbi:NDP-sugar pyrophosphorylase family protein [Kitasatospora sp. MAA19]|nr:NDP-sugar pyrophosphorylase family protein [Kitasatospora sp. MAA19]
MVVDSRLGPYAWVGRDCVVTGTRLQDSIVLDGVSLTGVRDLRHSLIGRSASVGTVAQGGEHVRLVVGDQTRVEVAA